MSLYYDVHQAFPTTGRWYLGSTFANDGREVDTSLFFHGEPLKLDPPHLLLVGGEDAVEVPLPLRMVVQQAGPSLPFTLGPFDLPVVSSPVADILQSVAAKNIQRIPVRIDNHDAPFEIINVVPTISCIDAQRSEIDWHPNRIPRKPLAIFKLVIDPSLTAGNHLFRLAGCSRLIISGTIKELLERAGATAGIQCDAVA